jgi:hypothetical protein
MKNNSTPWFGDEDPSKPYYAGISDSEIKFVKDKTIFFNHEGLFTQDVLADFNILLDFEAYDDFEINYPLFKWICDNQTINSKNNQIYWFPLGVSIDDYNPVMVARTDVNFSFLKIISSSMMQILNGAFCAIDKNGNFLAIFIDGYYLMAAIKRELFSNNLDKYIDSWFNLESKCDDFIIEKLKLAKLLYQQKR